jgi:D-serine deaminase-like pyridoxal phosphate-dependent protein
LAGTLAARGGRLAIAVDSLLGLQRLAQAADEAALSAQQLDVFIELDVGHGRCGVASGDQVVLLAQEVSRHSPLRFAGLQAYHGSAQHLRSVAERHRAGEAALDKIRGVCALLAAANLPAPLVTGAGSGSFAKEAASGVYGELQTGSFMFMDADYARNALDVAQPMFEHALFVKTQVMSVSAERAVCDAGHKSHAIDSGLPSVHGAALSYANGGDEHGILRALAPQGKLPELGEVLWLIPGHCDPTVNLHDVMVGVRGGLQHGIVEQLIAVDARGALT